MSALNNINNHCSNYILLNTYYVCQDIEKPFLSIISLNPMRQ